MEFGDFRATEAFNPTYKRIKELGLEQNVLDLDAYGFTVIPPEKVAPPEPEYAARCCASRRSGPGSS